MWIKLPMAGKCISIVWFGDRNFECLFELGLSSVFVHSTLFRHRIVYFGIHNAIAGPGIGPCTDHLGFPLRLSHLGCESSFICPHHAVLVFLCKNMTLWLWPINLAMIMRTWYVKLFYVPLCDSAQVLHVEYLPLFHR